MTSTKGVSSRDWPIEDIIETLYFIRTYYLPTILENIRTSNVIAAKLAEINYVTASIYTWRAKW